MTEVTAAVVAHIDRRERTNLLHSELSEQFPTAMFEDDGTLGCDYNHLHAWDSIASAATSPWCAVFEDDAEPVKDLAYHLGQALFYSPSPVVSLYLGRGRPVHWQRRIGNAMRFDRPFVVTTHLLHCVAVCIRTELVHELIEDAKMAINHGVHKPIDEALTEAVQNRNLPVAYTVPSLVQHADGPSVAAHRYQKGQPEPRVAWSVGVRDSWTGQFSVT
jgi:hypothetical protein